MESHDRHRLELELEDALTADRRYRGQLLAALRRSYEMTPLLEQQHRSQIDAELRVLDRRIALQTHCIAQLQHA